MTAGSDDEPWVDFDDVVRRMTAPLVEQVNQHHDEVSEALAGLTEQVAETNAAQARLNGTLDALTKELTARRRTQTVLWLAVLLLCAVAAVAAGVAAWRG
jgi:hypothetical protein